MQQPHLGSGSLLTGFHSDKPLGELALIPSHVKNNMEVLAYNRIWVSFLMGCIVGCSGVTGYIGFVYYLVAHVLLGALLYFKAQGDPAKFFPSKYAVFTSNIFAQQEILTFVLFWTLTNNIVFLF